MRGYSLIELITVVVVIGIIAGIGVPMLTETADAWFFTSRFQDNAVSSCMIIANRMSREIRRLLNDSSVVTASAAQLTLNINTSGLPYSTVNPISFSRSGNTLVRGENLTSDALGDNVTALTFTYFDDKGNIIAAPAVNPNNTDIRRIRVDLSILAASKNLGYRFEVRPQNLRRLNEKFK